jgi:hypothetical protein
VAGDTPLTLQQVRRLAARIVSFTNNLSFHSDQAVVSIERGQRISPDGWWKADCPLEGALHLQRQDPDNDKLLSVGDVVWLGYDTCGLSLSTPAGARVTWNGWILSAFDLYNSGVTFTTRLTYYDFNVVNSSGASHWLTGGIQVAGWVEHDFTTYKFEGFVIENGTTGARVVAKSGTERLLFQQGFLEAKFEDLDMRLAMEGRTRVKALVRLAEAARPVLFKDGGLADVPQQGAIELLLEPHRADGHRIVMTPMAGDVFRIDYLRGGTVLSSQTAPRLVLHDEGLP